MSEIITDENGTWEEITEKNGVVWRRHIQPSQKYIDEVLIPAQQKTVQYLEEQSYAQRRGERIQQLGDARTKDPDRIATEDAVLDGATSIIETTELDQLVAQLEWFGDKTLADLDQYIENNTGNVQKIRAFLKTLTRITWSSLNLVRILINRELPPEE